MPVQWSDHFPRERMGFHNVNVDPNGSPIGKGLHLSSQEDPFGDYASVDTEHALADERVFGVLKLTKLAATGSQRGQGQVQVHHLGRLAQL